MFLTDDELTDLTGYQRNSSICLWLDRHGYRYEIDARGKPRVLRQVVEVRLGLKPTNEPRLNLA
jgi:hypothetical protein